MIKQTKIFRSIIFLLIVFFATSCLSKQDKTYTDTAHQEEESLYAYGICVDSLNMNYYKIKNGDYLSSILMNLGFTGSDVELITETISPLYPPSKLQIGNTYAAICTPDTTSAIQYLVFEKSKSDYVVVDLSSDSLKVYESTKPIDLKRKYAEGTITSSLWNSIKCSFPFKL